MLQVCLNGARNRIESAHLPMTPQDLAEAACEAVEAGAQDIHLHPKNHDGEDTLDPDHTPARSGTNRAWEPCCGPRERALLTQQQLADRAELNVRTIRRLELDRARRPRSTSVYGLAKALSLILSEERELATAARAVSIRTGDVPATAGSGAGMAADEPLEPDSTPRQLPPVAAHFVGWRTELALLDDLHKGSGSATGTPLSVLIVGGAGMGKTTLALQWCSAVAADFPDGQLYVNLRGFGTLSPVEPLNALAVLLRSLGVAPDEIPDDLAVASALFRSLTANSRLLLLLDNALDSEQVRPLLPGHGCAVVVTSRDQLRSLAACEATARIHIPPLGPRDCVELLNRVSGRTTIAYDDPTVRTLTHLCDSSPLALRIIGERLARQPDVTVPEIVNEIANGHERFEVFYSGDALSDLRTVLSWSYQRLDRDAAWMLRGVSALYPGSDFSLAAAGAVSGFSVKQARRHLDRLVSTHLVEQHGDRYSLHDLVRAYAAGESRRHDSPSTRAAAVSRLLTWFIHSMYAADVAFTPGRMREPLGELEALGETMEPLVFADVSAALAWCDLEHQTLTALPAWAHDNGEPRAAGQIAYLLQVYLFHYGYHHDLLAGHRAALKAVRQIGDRRLEGHLLSAMGNASSELLRPKDAARYLHQALAAIRDGGDRRGEAKVLGNIAMNAIDVRDYVAARERCEQALAVVSDSGYEHGHAHTLDTLR